MFIAYALQSDKKLDYNKTANIYFLLKLKQNHIFSKVQSKSKKSFNNSSDYKMYSCFQKYSLKVLQNIPFGLKQN